MLARNRIVFLLDQLVGHGARVFLGDVIEAGVGRGHELDLDGDRLGHVRKASEKLREFGVSAGQTGPRLRGNLTAHGAKSSYRDLERDGTSSRSRLLITHDLFGKPAPTRRVVARG